MQPRELSVNEVREIWEEAQTYDDVWERIEYIDGELENVRITAATSILVNAAAMELADEPTKARPL